jgi:chromosome segregation ATPase
MKLQSDCGCKACLTCEGEEFMTNESKMLTMLENLTNDVGDIKQGQKRFELRMDGLEQDISGLKEDVSEMKQDISDLKEDVSELKQDVSILKEDVSEMKQDISGLKEDVSSLKEDNLSLKADNLSFKETHKVMFKMFDRIHESLARIENDQGYKINVLFDAYQANQDINNDNRQQLSVLEKRVDKHDLRLMALEKAE